jgi:tetratricopeptide (TPR) repeat protein
VRSLETGLDKSQAGVLVWSSATGDSEWVRGEYEAMEARANAKNGFRFIPVRLDATALPTFAANRVFIDFSQYPQGPNGGDLLRLLHAIVGKPLSEEAVHFAVEQDEAARTFTARVKAAVRNGQPAQLVTLFTQGGTPWETSSALGCAVAEGLTKLGEYDSALTVTDALAQQFPRAIRPLQLKALALARRGRAGDLEQAQDILGELFELKQRDPETVGIYARTWMDRYNATNNVLFLRQSRDLYAEAFASAQDDYYTGINAAAKSVFLATPDDITRGRESAQGIQAAIGTKKIDDDYWKTATVAESHLILGNYDQAAIVYGQAVAMAPTEVGSHSSTWQQACKLMAILKPDASDRARIRQAFAHLPDCP